MGTLFNQLERNPRDIDTHDIHAVYSWLDNINYDPSVTLEVMKYLQLKRIGDLMVRDGDVRDEQLHGMGLILQDIAASLKDIAAKINEH